MVKIVILIAWFIVFDSTFLKNSTKKVCKLCDVVKLQDFFHDIFGFVTYNMCRLIFVNYYAAQNRFYKLLSSKVLKLFYLTVVGKKAGQVMLSQDLLTCR